MAFTPRSANGRPHLRRALIPAAAAIALALGTAAPAMAAQPDQTGLPHACTKIGTNGNDRIYATHGYEVICGLGGDDVLVGGDGNDILIGGDGNDTIIGGGGNDEIDAGEGNDNVTGGDGNDVIDGAGGDDTIDGGTGADTINGGTGLNTCKTDATDAVSCYDKALPELDVASLQWVTPAVGNAVARPVTLRARATDDVSGIKYVFVYLSSPTGSASLSLTQKLVSGTANNGVFEMTGTMPAYAPIGEWRITNISLIDRVGQTRTYTRSPTGSYTATGGLTGTMTLGPLKVTGMPDLLLPELDVASLQWVTPTVDNAVARPVTLRARATDDVSGIKYVFVYLSSPTGSTSLSLTQKLVSGTANNGVFEMTGTMPAYAPIGEWRIANISVIDNVGQTRTYTRNPTGSYTATGAPNGTMTIGALKVTGVPDLLLPALDVASLQWAQSAVTNAVARPVTLRARATDDVSGIKYVFVYLSSPTGSTSLSLTQKLVSGTANDGVFEMTGTLPAYAPIGEWRIANISVIDNVGQTRTYTRNPTGTYTATGAPNGTMTIGALKVSCPA